MTFEEIEEMEQLEAAADVNPDIERPKFSRKGYLERVPYLNHLRDIMGDQIINLTPHPVVLNDGTTYPPSGTVARVSQEWTPPPEVPDHLKAANNLFGRCKMGPIEGLPPQQNRTYYIVSAMIAGAAPIYRGDLVVPATGHPDTVRNEQGHIVSVPFLYRMGG